MEKIIANEISPTGIDSEILEILSENEALNSTDTIIYYGFPIFKDYEGESVKSKFLILSRLYGIILIVTTNQHEIQQDDEHLSQLYNFIESSIKKSRLLRRNKKELAINIESYLYSINPSSNGNYENEVLSSLEELSKLVNSKSLEDISNEIFNETRSIIEGAKALIGHSNRTKISDDPKNKSNILIELEKEISNFDIEQRKIAINLISGPQRIRGLAGSGKTIVLAMKAAHIHLQYPNKKILFTFYTKSLYDCIKEYIIRFYRHFAGTEPMWEYIDILHSWGGKNIDGVAFNAAVDNDLPCMTFSQAKNINYNDPFSIVCEQLEQNNIQAKYDYILIDEAQDLPNSFFKLCYKLAKGETGENKNIVWAYDDLQSIFKIYQRTPEELFGSTQDGIPKISLSAFSTTLGFGQSNDLVLFKCYRNPLDVLLSAHALGFGLYSNNPVQMLENKEHWEDVGYTIDEEQSFVVGQEVCIKREQKNSPLTIYDYQETSDIIKYYPATNMEDECDWVVNNIKDALAQGLKPHDILVISLDDRYAKDYFSKISFKLSTENIRSNNLLSSNATIPAFKLDDMVTLSTVYRAKGNESAMVFTVGIDALYDFRNNRSGRNRIFTAFTRTKAWLYVSGWGDKAQFFFDELQKSLDNSPYLRFIMPDTREIDTIQRNLNSKPKPYLKIAEEILELKDQGYTPKQIRIELETFLVDNEDI